MEQDTKSVPVEGESPLVHQYEVVVALREAPREVLLSGRPLEKLADPGVRAGKAGWTFDSHTSTLQIFFLNNDFNLRIGI